MIEYWLSAANVTESSHRQGDSASSTYRSRSLRIGKAENPRPVGTLETTCVVTSSAGLSGTPMRPSSQPARRLGISSSAIRSALMLSPAAPWHGSIIRAAGITSLVPPYRQATKQPRSEAIGTSRTNHITPATLPSRRINRASAATQVWSPGSAASATTCCAAIRPEPSARTDTPPRSPASIQ
jgi:hypothetical protein